MMKSSTSKFFSFFNVKTDYSFIENPVPVFYLLFVYYNRMRVYIREDRVDDFDVIPEYIDWEFYNELKKYSEKEILNNSDYFHGLIEFFEWYGGVDFEEIGEMLISLLSHSNGKFANCSFSKEFMAVIADLIFVSNGDIREVLDLYGATGTAHLMQNEWGRECFDSITTYAPDVEYRLITGVRTYLNRLPGCDICGDDPLDNLNFIDKSLLLYNSPATWSAERINSVIAKYIDSSDWDTAAILHLPAKFCYAPEYGESRVLLIEENLLSKVILLPDGVCDNLNESSVIIFLEKLNMYREDKSKVTFVDARGYISENGDFLGERLGNDLFGYASNKGRYHVMLSDNFVEVNLKESEQFVAYFIHPLLYTIREQDLSKDLVRMAVSSIFSCSEGAKKYDENTGFVLTDDDFITSSEELFQKGAMARSQIPEGYVKHKGKSVIISTERGKFEIALISEDVVFYTKPEHWVWSYNGPLSQGTDISYFAHAILSNEYTNYGLLICLPHINKDELFSCMAIPVLFDADDRLEFVEELKRSFIQLHSKDSEVQRITSDLSHMLSLTFSTLSDKVKYLIDSSFLSESDKIMVKQIDHNVKYISRSIDAYHSDFLVSNPKEYEVGGLVSDYVEAWKSLGREGFELEFKNLLNSDVQAILDRTQIFIMLDTILENARRHGFGKQMKSGNLVLITLSMTEYDGKYYVSVKVANNGNKLPSDFTIDCYIRKGQFAGKYGRSGLGGYHVARITEQHRGKLDIYSTDEWGTVVEVLLPIKNY